MAKKERDSVVEGLSKDFSFLRQGVKFKDSLSGNIKQYFHTHLDNYASAHGRWLEGTLFLLNLFAIVLFVIETHNISDRLQEIVRWTEVAVVGVFAVEYAVRMWVAEKKMKHFVSMYSMIDLLSILPIVVNFVNLSFFRIFRILRLFRLLRLFRILRFQRMFKEKETMFGKLTDTQLIVIRLVLTMFTIIFVFSGLIWNVESRMNPGYGTIWHAMYFSVVTLSTVGYGDITPLSPLGRVITVAMIFSGIGLIPWQLGKLLKILFMSAMKVQVKCRKCGLEEHDKMSKYCHNCGNKLPKVKKKVLDEEAVEE